MSATASGETNGPYYVIFDVEILDGERYRTFMEQVKPALDAAGGRYLVRGGEHVIYEGDWNPTRLVLLEFPSKKAWESFYYGSAYTKIRPVRDEASRGRMVGVQGLTTGA